MYFPCDEKQDFLSDKMLYVSSCQDCLLLHWAGHRQHRHTETRLSAGGRGEYIRTELNFLLYCDFKITFELFIFHRNGMFK